MGIGDFAYIIAARCTASLISAIGIVLAVFLVLMTFYWQAALCLVIFLLFAYWANVLIRDLEPGRLRTPFGELHRAAQPAAFWFFFCLFCLLIPAVLAAVTIYFFSF